MRRSQSPQGRKSPGKPRSNRRGNTSSSRSVKAAERPIVAVVENKDGELLGSHTLLDLMLEKDIEIQEVVDHYEHFSETEDQSYQIFQSIQIP